MNIYCRQELIQYEYAQNTQKITQTAKFFIDRWLLILSDFIGSFP